MPSSSVGRSSALWSHKSPQSTRIWQFKARVEAKYGVHLPDYEALRQWSIAELESFWTEVWQFTGIRCSSAYSHVVAGGVNAHMFPRPAFFEGARLNFAENLLFPLCNPAEDSLAIITATESSRDQLTWRQLRKRVTECTHALKALGVVQGDRLAGYSANNATTLIAMLSATSIGAIWTGVSPDTGAAAVLDRLIQIEPKVLFSDNAVMYNGRNHSSEPKLAAVVLGLPTLAAVILFETVPNYTFELANVQPCNGKAWRYAELLQATHTQEPHEFNQLPADHPVYILYSSGTTGKPKCIVHGAVGTLIQHKKEHDIQCDIRPGDRLFYFTTCSWMMWHWLVSGLASGATLILYDGSPYRPLDETGAGEMAMPSLIEELSITHFGTSAKFLSILEQKALMPKNRFGLESLKAVYSTGSPLAPSTFEYVYQAFGPDINLGSITGGTDIISLFGAPSQILPVFAGEIQARGLGMAVEVWDYQGKDITKSGDPGDLVCVKPFPCQPVAFWGSNGERVYEKSYFETFPGVWHHGDFLRIDPQTGGLIMLGRSDGVLKPAGVRFGSAEIYNILLKHFPQIEDALCIGRRRESDMDETVVLFVKMIPGQHFSDALKTQIQGTVRTELSARHVPGIIEQCTEIPVTTNGKKVEVAVKQILCGLNVKTSASVANSECLEWYREWNNTH